MKRKLTIRNLAVPVEVRSSEDGAKYISGVIPYNKESEDMGFVEVVRRGAFDGSLKNGDVRCLWSHNTQYVLGRSTADTLKLEDRQDGLHFECQLPDTAWAADLYRSIERKDVPGVSFGFVAKVDKWTHRAQGEPTLRELIEVDLYEISVGVAFPAYPDAEASTRALLENAGLNFDAITSCIRNKENDCITKDDVEAVRAVITSLENLISGNKKSDSADFDVRAREIDLLESEYTIGV